jgi:putative zinc finger protein
MEPEILKAALAPGPDCLPLDELGRYADGSLTSAERASAAAHIRGCVNCRAELALLQAVTSGPVRSDEVGVIRDGLARLGTAPAVAVKPAPISSARSWFHLTPRLAALVALVLLSVVVGRTILRDTGAPELPASVSTGTDVSRSQTVTLRAPVGDLPDPPQRFEWLAVDRAARYRARLMEVDRREVWSTSTTDAWVDLPREVRALSAPLKTLLWDVTAYDASGSAIARSERRTFRVVPH